MAAEHTLDALAGFLGVSERAVNVVLDASAQLNEVFSRLDTISTINQAKVLSAFKANKISTTHFSQTTGYGYGDMGREKLSALFAHIFKAEDAIVSPHLLSGTHAIFLALSAMIKPDETMVSVYGRPYDTLGTAIGLSEKNKDNTLIARGIQYDEIPLTDEDKLDVLGFEQYLKTSNPKVIYIQRSRGYAYKPSLTIADIKMITNLSRKYAPESIIICDNCYGEFCESHEPLEVGADIIIGSLIKNPGGGLAPNGGYIAGKRSFIEMIGERMTAPGIGVEIGSYGGSYLPFFQGIFLAPKVVVESLKGAVITARVMEALGYNVLPKWDAFRTDITQSITFNNKDELIAFIQGIQLGAPVDSHVKPVPWDMPGYDSDVIMAAGTFIQGASIELSADAPIKKPYIAYMQGGLTVESVMFGLMTAIDKMNIL